MQGAHSIVLSDIEGVSCGLLPIGGPATVTTRGLRWNLGLISRRSVNEHHQGKHLCFTLSLLTAQVMTRLHRVCNVSSLLSFPSCHSDCQELRFGGLVSTSNEVLPQRRVHINTSDPIVFTVAVDVTRSLPNV
jgi:hypothetical protein